MRGTRLANIMTKIELDHEDPQISCWLYKNRTPPTLYIRELLYFNLFQPTSQHFELKHPNVTTSCVNPWHMVKGKYISQGWLYPFDHAHVTNRWALLLWYLLGNEDYQIVSLEDAIQLSQEESGFQSIRSS